MTQDGDLEKRVLGYLAGEPGIDSETVRADVDEGLVTLMGTVADHEAVWRAERAVVRVHGVRALVNMLAPASPGHSPLGGERRRHAVRSG